MLECRFAWRETSFAFDSLRPADVSAGRPMTARSTGSNRFRHVGTTWKPVISVDFRDKLFHPARKQT